MTIKSLSIKNWNQFGDLDIDFHPRLTVFTGANGTGKSTIIRLIGNMIGWQYLQTAVPSIDDKDGYEEFVAGLKKLLQLKKEENNERSNGKSKIGKIEFEGGEVSLLVPDKTNTPNYTVEYQNVGDVNTIKGVFIPSHKIPYSYKKVESIPSKPITKKEAFDRFNSSIRKMQIAEGKFINFDELSPILHLKSTLMSLAIFGEGNRFINKNEEAYELFMGFIEILRKLLPESLGFQELNIRSGEIVLVTRTGEFLIDAVSGGIGALIDMAWQIYMFDSGESSFVVITDEPENHLHPSMQRSLLPNLLSAFPNVQFILATHSPFIVSSVQDSNVYAFKYNEDNAVVAQKLDFESKVGNATEVLRDILGVPVTLPVWVENKLEEIVKEFREKEITAESYQQLKEKLRMVGLDEYLPQALGSI